MGSKAPQPIPENMKHKPGDRVPLSSPPPPRKGLPVGICIAPRDIAKGEMFRVQIDSNGNPVKILD